MATAAQAARQDVGPQDGDPVAMLHQQQLADPTINKPEKPWATAELEPHTTGFRFRSKPGFRLLAFTFRVPPETGDEDLEARYKKAYGRIWKDKQKEFQAEQRFANDYGDRRVVFKPVPGKFECYLNLDADQGAVASWLRKRPEFGVSFYEEMAPMTVTLPSGETISVVPADDASRQALAAATT